MRRSVLGVLVGVGLIVFLGLPAAALAVDEITATEGQVFSGRVVSVGSCTVQSGATIYWGDGTATSAGTSDGAGGIKGTHTYADERTANGNVSYTCSAGGASQNADFQATVQDAPLSGAGRNISGTAGQSLTSVTAHVTDGNHLANRSDDFYAQISWGDGTTTEATITAVSGGEFDVEGTHTYASAGTYPVNTTVQDVGGSSTSATSSAQIAKAPDPPPRIVSAPVVSGPAHETDVLTTTNGIWSGSPTSFQYQWLRCAKPSGAGCVVIAGATASTYKLVHADVGSTMRSRVRGSNAVGTSLPADSDPTAAVKPLVLTARFTVTPNPFCTGVRVTFNATGSQTPNPPIERYRFTEDAGSDTTPAAAFHSPAPAPWIIADWARPLASEIPTYDIHWNDVVPPFPSFDGLWQATPRTVTLTVWDHSGASASTSQFLPLAVRGGFEFSNSSRANCPPSAPPGARGDVLLRDVKLKVSPQALSAKIRCPSLTDCIGRLQIDQASPRRRPHLKLRSAPSAAAARRAAPRPVVLASSSFYIVGHRSATITTKLTRAGRSLLRGGKRVSVVERLTTVTPSGRTITQSHALTLPGKKKRR